MGDYNVSQKPINQMSSDEIQLEAQELRIHISVIESELSKRRAWERAEQKEDLRWLARTRSYRAMLVSRYSRIRPKEKEINRARHSHKVARC